jgi:outer membrane protein assembly factor BamB
VTIGTAPQFGHIAVANGVLFLPTSDGHLYAVHTGNGAVLADFTFSKPVGSPAIANGRVFVPYSGSAPVPEGQSGGGVVALALPGSICATP